MSLFPSIRLSIHPSIHPAPSLRNRTSSDHNFWYTYLVHTYVKWWYLHVFFSVFQNFDFLDFHGGKRGKNGPKWEKTLSLFISQEPYIRLSFMVHLCKMIITPGGFLSFFQNFDFWGVKGQKMVQNDKKLCLLCSISQEPYLLKPETGQNNPKPAKTTWNKPKPAKMTQSQLKRPMKNCKRTHNDPKFWNCGNLEFSTSFRFLNF